jgi:hypothetical protein
VYLRTVHPSKLKLLVLAVQVTEQALAAAAAHTPLTHL